MSCGTNCAIMVALGLTLLKLSKIFLCCQILPSIRDLHGVFHFDFLCTFSGEVIGGNASKLIENLEKSLSFGPPFQ